MGKLSTDVQSRGVDQCSVQDIKKLDARDLNRKCRGGYLPAVGSGAEKQSTLR